MGQNEKKAGEMGKKNAFKQTIVKKNVFGYIHM
jgi:hypothetical protein